MKSITVELSQWDIDTINSAVSQKLSNFCDGIPEEEKHKGFIKEVLDDYRQLLFKIRGAREILKGKKSA